MCLLQEEGCDGGLRQASVQEKLPFALWTRQQLSPAVLRSGRYLSLEFNKKS